MSSAEINTSGHPDHVTAVYRAAAAVSVLLFALRPITYLFPQARLWGINHLLFLPFEFLIVYLVGSVLCLVAFIPAVGNYLSERFRGAGEYLFEGRRRMKWVDIAVILIPVFWFLRMPTNLLGDGYTVINNIAGDLPTIFKWSETGSVAVVYAVSRLIPVEGLARGEYAYAIVSVLSGAVSVFFLLGIAYEIGSDAASRLFCACLLLFTGWSLLFFGYAENYPVLWPMITGYLYFGIRYLAGKNSIVVPIIFLVASAALHLQTLFYFPSIAVIILGRGFGSRLYKRNRIVIWISLAVIGAAAVAAFVWRYHHSISFAVHFLPLFKGRPATPDYAIFSLNHLIDMVNELLLLMPLLPVLVIIGWNGLKRILRHTTPVFLLVFACGGVILLLVFDPRIGMGRDWDLFATVGPGVMMILLWATVHAEISLMRLYAPMALLAAILVFPFFATNLSAGPSIEYMKWLLDLDKSKSPTGMIMLRNYFRDTGNTDIADSIEIQIREHWDMLRYYNLANEYAASGRFQEAMAVVDTVFALDPYSRDSYSLRGTVYSAMGRYDEAIADFETSLEMEPYNFIIIVNLARVYYKTGQHEPMMKYLRRAEELNPESDFVLQALAMGFLAKQQYDSAYVYGRRLLQVDSTAPNGHLATGVYFYSTGLPDSAVVYLERYVELIGPGPDRDRALRLLKTIGEERQKQ